jgi:hypothetical protein
VAIIGYVDETDLTAYAAARGITLTDTESVLLTKALDWIELQDYQGVKTDPNQALQWPRKGFYLDGVLQDENTVPMLVEELQLQLAIDIDQGTDPNAVREQDVKQETVFGAVSVTYQDNSGASQLSQKVQAIMSKLIGGARKWEFGRTRG